MSRPYRRNYPVHAGSLRSSSYSNSAPDTNPFGPAMADWAFGVNSIDDCEEAYDVVEDEDYAKLPLEEKWYQSEMDLETVEEKAERLEREINRFRRAYKAMAYSAMKWHYLETDCEENEQINKMFKDMQMIRKLSGSENV